jgi:hypothetical protein
MRSRGVRAAVRAALLLLGLSPSVASAAAEPEEVRLFERPLLDAELGSSYRKWTVKKAGVEEAEVSEFAAPLRVRVPIGERADLSLSFSGVSARLLADGGSHYRGPADATLSASYLARGRTRLAVQVGFPTGEPDPDASERAIATIAANRILGFPVRRFGEGLDAGASLVQGYAPTRSLVLSAGAGFLRKGEYTYTASGGTERKYNPGDETFFAAGMEWEWGRTTGVSLGADLRYRLFSADRRDGEDYYEEGDEVDLLVDAALLFAPGRRAGLELFFAFKGDGSEEGAFALGSLDSLTVERYLLRDLTGDYREVSAFYEHRVHPRVDLLARAQAGEYGGYSLPAGIDGAALLGGARVYELGGGLGIAVTPSVRLRIDAARLAGDAEDGAIELAGYDLGAAVHWSY